MHALSFLPSAALEIGHYSKDPLGKLGFGVLSYLNLIKSLMLLFLFLSIVHIPLMSKYSKWDPLPDMGIM
jgi:hypothetical protein